MERTWKATRARGCTTPSPWTPQSCEKWTTPLIGVAAFPSGLAVLSLLFLYVYWTVKLHSMRKEALAAGAPSQAPVSQCTFACYWHHGKGAVVSLSCCICRLIADEAFREDLVSRIAKVGVAIEEALGSAQDVEGAVEEDGSITVVQTRPQM